SVRDFRRFRQAGRKYSETGYLAHGIPGGMALRDLSYRPSRNGEACGSPPSPRRRGEPMAKEDETALMLLNTEQKNELQQAKRQTTEMTKGMPGPGTLAVGGVSALTGAVIGGAEGMKTGGDATAEKALKHIGGGLALVAGTAGAIAAGSGNPKARAAAAG